MATDSRSGLRGSLSSCSVSIRTRSNQKLVSVKTWKPNSLDLVELIMAFEEEFGGEISDETAQKITTVGDAINYIENNM